LPTTAAPISTSFRSRRDSGLEVLYYNKAIFDEAKVAYPTDSWTWDDLLDAAKKLTIVESNGRVKRYGLGMEGGKWSLWLNQNKAGMLDDCATLPSVR
jgi:multiple sugar transport system substrate-binding protein